MITRIVKLTFRQEVSVEKFRKLYTERNPETRGVQGCIEVKVMKDIHEPYVYYTVSKWTSNEALEAYRSSAYFAETWPMVKSFLSAKTEVISMTTID